ncbi:hypothetical protein L2712_18835 [Shewanella marisflavi]|uniref:hypothetical protein n=1 Tax=Shewanella marisflavi TaxID=260364 RepID=UPI00200F379D|nr:hypothetical protein [Shewanella marisflavi]MCL1043687.1 hypothetical protein [Shewanella marisflavi]
MNKKLSSDVDTLAFELERELMHRYSSPLLTGERLANAMGYRSIHSLRKHMSQPTFPVELFTISGRRGRFALVKDIALWLAKQRIEHQYQTEEKPIDM